jgi:integrase
MSRKPQPWFDAHNGAWYTTHKGDRVRLADGPRNASTQKLAYDAFYTFMSQREGEEPKSKPATVLALFNRYLHHKKGEIGKRTFQVRRYYLEEFAHRFGNKLVGDLVPFDLTNWIKQNEQRWVSSDTRSMIIRIVKGAFTWGLKQGILPKHPFPHVPAPFTQRRTPATKEHFDQVRALFWDDPRFQELLDFLFWTGCRPSEARRARWEGFDATRGILVLARHKSYGKLKEKKPRVIYLTDEACELLKKIQERRDSPEWIFVSRAHSKQLDRSTIPTKIKTRCDEAGIPVLHSYTLRHHFGTEAVKRGVPLKLVSELMGHRSVKTTEVYVALGGEVDLLRQAAERVVGSTFSTKEKKGS